MKIYVNSQGIETLISICSRTARRWLCKLGNKYKDVCKDVFVDEHKQSDIVKDHINFLRKMEELKPYIVKFDENGKMKPKVYPSDCVMRGENRQPIIVIIYNKCTFSENDGVYKAWT